MVLQTRYLHPTNEGSVSALNYSMSVKTFIQSVFSVAITTMIYPMLSQSIAEMILMLLKWSQML